jgi:hypothetical protein
MASQDPVSAASPPAAGLPRLAMRSHLRRGIIPVEDTPLWPIEKALGRKVSGEYTVPVCRLLHRELHRYGDEAPGWTAVVADGA